MWLGATIVSPQRLYTYFGSRTGPRAASGYWKRSKMPVPESGLRTDGYVYLSPLLISI